jgi:uncharacterized protein (TIGR00725 family)
MIVAVIGNSSCSPEEAKLAEIVGELLAEQGVTVICGGLGGVMEATCRGVKCKGGLTIGILPGQDAGTANPWVDIPVVTGLGEARNVVVAKSAQAVIAIGGGYGTLSEIAYALKSGIHVIGLNTWSLSRKGQENDPIIRVQSAAEAVDKAISLAQKHTVHRSDSPLSSSPASSPVQVEKIGRALAKRRKNSEIATPRQVEARNGTKGYRMR